MKLLWTPFRGDGLTDAQNQKTMTRINVVLEGWLGTKHVAGQRCKGVAVDCVQLVCAFLDEMANVPRGTTVIPRLPQQTGQNDPEGIKGAPVLKGIIKKNPAKFVKTRLLQPGDIIVCQLGAGGGPGHAMIVTGLANSVIHACNAAGQVVRTGIGSVKTAMHVYRVDNRINWHKGNI